MSGGDKRPLMFPPTRSLVLESYNDDPLYELATRALRRCARRKPQHQSAPPAKRFRPLPWPKSMPTVEQLALAFAEQVNCVRFDATAAKTMAAQICYLKRQLAFSAEEFVDVWLHHLQEPATTAWPLTAYRHLGCATLDALSLTLVVQRSEKSWFILQCRLLEDDDLLQDYLEAVVVTSRNNPDRAWSILNELCHDEWTALANWREIKEPKRSITPHLLNVLHDPRRLRWLSTEERHKLVMSRIMYQIIKLRSSEQPSNLLQDMLQSKLRVILDHNVMASHEPSMKSMVQWFPDSDSSKCPALLQLALDEDSLTSNKCFLFSLFSVRCRLLADEDDDVVHAAAIMENLNQILAKQIQGNVSIEKLALLLAFVQIFIHQLGSAIGIKYHKWFEETFVDPSTTKLSTKRVVQLFISGLEDMIPYEMPAILQIQGKVMQQFKHLSAANYVTAVKSRLMGLGLDHALRQYPGSIHCPLQSSGQTGQSSFGLRDIREEVEDVLISYTRTGAIPQKLWENSIFIPAWFKRTFIPALMDWCPRQVKEERAMILLDARDNLMGLFRQKKRISEEVYANFLRRRSKE